MRRSVTRANVMHQASNLKTFAAPLLIPGITLNTTPTDYVPIKQFQLMRFKGEAYEKVGELLTAAWRRPPPQSAPITTLHIPVKAVAVLHRSVVNPALTRQDARRAVWNRTIRRSQPCLVTRIR